MTRAAWLLCLVAACAGDRGRSNGVPVVDTEPAHEGTPPCVATHEDTLGRTDMARLGGHLGRALSLVEPVAAACEAPETLYTLGLVLADLTLDARALATLRRFLEVEPHEEHEQEVRELIAEIEKRPPHRRPEATTAEIERARLLYRHGANLRLEGKHDAAIQRFEQSYGLWPYPLTLVQISLAHRGAGRELEARRYNERAMAVAELLSGHKAVARLITDHSDDVREVAYSPAGKRIASIAQDRQLKVWDAASGRVLETLTLERWADSVAFADEDRIVVGGGSLGVAFLFDLRDRSRKALPVPSGVRVVAVSADGASLAYVGKGDRLVGVYSLREGTRWETALAWSARQVVFDAAGATVGVGGDRTAAFDVATGKPQCAPGGAAGSAHRIAFSPDGQLVIGVGAERITVMERDGCRIRATMAGAVKVQAVAFTPNGEWLVVAGAGDIDVWEVKPSLRRHKRVSNPARFSAGLAVSPDGGTLAVAGGEPVIHLLDTFTGAPVRQLGSARGRRTSLAISDAGARMAVGSHEGTIALWRLDRVSAPQLLRQSDDESIVSLAFNRAGTRLAAVDGGKRAVLWDARTGKKLAAIDGVISAIFDRSGDRLLVGGEGGRLAVHDPRNGAELRATSGRTDQAFDVRDVSPDGSHVAIGVDGGFRLQNLATGRGLFEIRGLERPSALAYVGDGARLAVGPVDDGLALFDAAVPGKPVREVDAHPGGVYHLAWSGDGSRAATAGWREHDIAVWRVSDWGEEGRLRGHTGPIGGLAFGRGRVVSAGADKTVRVWDPDAAAELATVYVGDQAGDWIVLASDGRLDGSDRRGSQERIYWQIGDIVLPGFVGWSRAHTPGLLRQLMGYQ